MKFLLFVQHPYALGILSPLASLLESSGTEYRWYIPANKDFNPLPPVVGLVSQTLEEIYDWSPSVIFCPGNEVPYWMPGLKVQIFHGLAGEKKGHFRIRHYFDLYLTPGPWFTEKFQSLAEKHGDFKVTETGWSKLDPLYQRVHQDEAIATLQAKSKKYKGVLLYAPTFSPSLTSAPELKDHIFKAAEDLNLLLVIKFHDLTHADILQSYHAMNAKCDSAEIYSGRNILPVMHLADIMVSDTSSVVYEFLLLDKPVITYKSNSDHIRWSDISNPDRLTEEIRLALTDDPASTERKWFVANYHPYADGISSERMIEASLSHIKSYGIPSARKLKWHRKIKIDRLFGKKPSRGR